MHLLIRAFLWLGTFFLSGFIKRILAGAGIGLVSFVAQQAIFNAFINYLRTNINLLSSLTIIMFDLSGIFICLSLIVSAIGIRMTMNSGKLAFRKL